MRVPDYELNFLGEAAALVDRGFSALEREAQTSPDADAFGVYDRIEYMAGFGFVACQTYMVAVASRYGLKRSESFVLGPQHRTGRAMVEITNAAANHWKHSSEWELGALDRRAQTTLDILRSVGVDTSAPYAVGNVLHKLLAPHAMRFGNLIPFISQWRDLLHEGAA